MPALTRLGIALKSGHVGAKANTLGEKSTSSVMLPTPISNWPAQGLFIQGRPSKSLLFFS